MCFEKIELLNIASAQCFIHHYKIYGGLGEVAEMVMLCFFSFRKDIYAKVYKICAFNN